MLGVDELVLLPELLLGLLVEAAVLPERARADVDGANVDGAAA